MACRVLFFSKSYVSTSFLSRCKQTSRDPVCVSRQIHVILRTTSGVDTHPFIWNPENPVYHKKNPVYLTLVLFALRTCTNTYIQIRPVQISPLRQDSSLRQLSEFLFISYYDGDFTNQINAKAVSNEHWGQKQHREVGTSFGITL